MTKTGVAYLAASFLTTQRVHEVAADYLEWLDEQGNSDRAQDALLAAARSSKNSDRVLAKADEYYADFSDGTPGDGDNEPVIDEITPDEGDIAGGTSVTITGEHLLLTSAVSFGGSAGTSLTVVDDTEVTVTTPAHAAGPVDVVLTTPAGTVTAEGAFTFVDYSPEIASITPNEGDVAGGTSVTITGEHLTGTTKVEFGGVEGTSLNVVDDTEVTVTTPAGQAAGPVDVVLTTPKGTATAVNGFTYTEAG